MAMPAPARAYHEFSNDQAPSHTFAVGDIVRLISETKRMTVDNTKDGFVEAVWLDQNDVLQFFPFEPEMLVLIKCAGD